MRTEWIAGAEEEWRKRTRRPKTAEELERVLRHYPGNLCRRIHRKPKAGVTDPIDQEDQPIESRRIEQYPTVGPGLVVHWYVRSIVIEVDYEAFDSWVVTDVHTGSREVGPSTVVRLERR